MLDWLGDLIHDELRRRFYHDPRVTARMPAVQAALLRGEITAVRAAQILAGAARGSRRKFTYQLTQQTL